MSPEVSESMRTGDVETRPKKTGMREILVKRSSGGRQ